MSDRRQLLADFIRHRERYYQEILGYWESLGGYYSDAFTCEVYLDDALSYLVNIELIVEYKFGHFRGVV